MLSKRTRKSCISYLDLQQAFYCMFRQYKIGYRFRQMEMIKLCHTVYAIIFKIHGVYMARETWIFAKKNECSKVIATYLASKVHKLAVDRPHTRPEYPSFVSLPWPVCADRRLHWRNEGAWLLQQRDKIFGRGYMHSNWSPGVFYQ